MYSKLRLFIIMVAVVGANFIGVIKTTNAAAYWGYDGVINGGFENSTHGYLWEQYQNDILCPNDCLITNAGSAASGSYFAKLGGTINTVDRIAAPTYFHGLYYKLPSDAVKLVFSYKYKYESSDMNDFADVVIGDVQHPFPLPSYTYYAIDAESGWTDGGIDVTSLKGKYILFYFDMHNDNTPGTASTFYVDDVSLTAYYLDTTKPTGSIRINNNKKSTKKAKVTLNLSASDNVSGVAYMRLSNNGKKWSNWYSYATTKRWDLTKKAYGGSKKKGTKRVYVQFRDGMGNISKTYKDSIKYK